MNVLTKCLRSRMMGADTVIALVLTGLTTVIGLGFGLVVESSGRFSGDGAGAIGIPLVFVLGAIIALLPFWIAKFRGVPSSWRFLALTLAAVPLDTIVVGWVVWVVCLIWSLAAGAGAETEAGKADGRMIRQDAPPGNVGDELPKLVGLREAGHLTAEEFEEQKRKLL